MARDKGFFAENGVSVELVCCPGGTGEVKKDRENIVGWDIFRDQLDGIFR